MSKKSVLSTRRGSGKMTAIFIGIMLVGTGVAFLVLHSSAPAKDATVDQAATDQSANASSGIEIANASTTANGYSAEFLAAITEVKILWAKNDFANAVLKSEDAFGKAANDKERAIADYWVGASHFKLGQNDQAIASELAATKFDPTYGAPYVTLAAVSLGKPDCAQALTYAKKAVELDTSYPWSHNNLGLAYLCLGQKPQGVTELQAALKLDPKNTVIADNLQKAQASK